eukprot:CAMPEP_0118930408 /NCGR_PEP_ID=MMETSP1169-20130426/7107_1 /TAXON_ID=36882 /ORGANISM="Pyramimonas obovata, Strain CCMP722" /LENGTH=272 /DNA_ID=CAMNT_0006872759 /DNA_START=23 /DNA_END=838 /DNA_ORIENTATION=-
MGEREREVCRDYLKGVCFRGNCRYAHTTPDGASASQPVCRDFENGRCFRASCRFYHRAASDMVARDRPAGPVVSLAPNANASAAASLAILNGKPNRVQMMSPGIPGSPTHSMSPNHPSLLQSMAVQGMGPVEGSQVPSQFAVAAVAAAAASGFPPSAYGHFMNPPLPAGAPMSNMKNKSHPQAPGGGMMMPMGGPNGHNGARFQDQRVASPTGRPQQQQQQQQQQLSQQLSQQQMLHHGQQPHLMPPNLGNSAMMGPPQGGGLNHNQTVPQG